MEVLEQQRCWPALWKPDDGDIEVEVVVVTHAKMRQEVASTAANIELGGDPPPDHAFWTTRLIHLCLAKVRMGSGDWLLRSETEKRPGLKWFMLGLKPPKLIGTCRRPFRSQILPQLCPIGKIVSI